MFHDATRDALAREVSKLVTIEIDPKASHRQNRFGANWLKQLDLTNLSVPVWGRVVDDLASYNLYKVQLENSVTVWCSLGLNTSLSISGARQLNTLHVNTPVYVLMHPTSATGTIIAVDPTYTIDPSELRSDFISQASRCGLFVDSAFKVPFGFNQNGGAYNFNAGRPIDSLVGEWGAVTETGLMVFLDPFMFQARVDEETGLWLFYADQLARLAGHNLEIRSTVKQSEYFDDQSEPSAIHHVFPFYHEALGVFKPGVGNTVSRTYGSDAVQNQSQEYSYLEPLFDDQQAFPRVISYEGYLGQGGHEYICIPPAGTLTTNTNRYSTVWPYIGVFESFKALTGEWAVKSAKGITFSKRCAIPVPKQIIRPEDQRGDNSSNYKAAGIFGPNTAPSHVLFDQPHLHVGEAAAHNVVTAANISELAAYSFNWLGAHPLALHSRDLYFPEEGSAGLPATGFVPIPFDALVCNPTIDQPAPISMYVDHRFGNVNYYPNESHFKMLDDGGIVISDGYGSEIKMTGGNVHISCPGDVYLQPGRNVQLWAGNDLIAKAVKSMDFTTTLKDITFKAEQNYRVLSGNSGYGGTLFENRAICPVYEFVNQGEDETLSGITFRANNSYVLSTAQKTVIRTAYSGNHDGEGDICLQSAKNIKLSGVFVQSYASSAILEFIGSAINERWQNASRVDTPLYINGDVATSGSVLANNWIAALNGQIASGVAAQSNYAVAALDSISTTSAQTTINYIATRKTQLTPLFNQYFGAGAISYTESVFANYFFSLRSEAQYRTSQGYSLFEARWQQMARLAGANTHMWTETFVLDKNGNATYPFPGKAWWKDTASFRTIDPTLYSVTAGLCVNRATGAAYAGAVMNASAGVVADGNYRVIMYG